MKQRSLRDVVVNAQDGGGKAQHRVPPFIVTNPRIHPHFIWRNDKAAEPGPRAYLWLTSLSRCATIPFGAQSRQR